MDFIQIKKVVTEFVSTNFKTTGKLIELKKNEDGWTSKIEIIEESEYVRSLGKSDIIGLYQIHISSDGEIIEFKRLLLRERSTLNAD